MITLYTSYYKLWRYKQLALFVECSMGLQTASTINPVRCWPLQKVQSLSTFRLFVEQAIIAR